MRMHIAEPKPGMTKVISLSERAYGILKRRKRSNESFSDVVVRMAGERDRRSILDFAGAWKGDDIDKVFSIVQRDRERASSRKLKL
jgi:predicted CopG family antitoxin